MTRWMVFRRETSAAWSVGWSDSPWATFQRYVTTGSKSLSPGRRYDSMRSSLSEFFISPSSRLTMFHPFVRTASQVLWLTSRLTRGGYSPGVPPGPSRPWTPGIRFGGFRSPCLAGDNPDRSAPGNDPPTPSSRLDISVKPMLVILMTFAASWPLSHSGHLCSIIGAVWIERASERAKACGAPVAKSSRGPRRAVAPSSCGA